MSGVKGLNFFRKARIGAKINAIFWLFKDVVSSMLSTLKVEGWSL